MSSDTKLRPTVLGTTPSFGFGDRLGTATAGHLESLRRAGGPIKGIFAQQSIREMQRTERTADEVMAAAAVALESAGFDDVWGADADHLKTPDDVRYTADAGFVFFTIDPSGHVDQQADNYDLAALEEKFPGVKEAASWFEGYLDKTIQIKDGPTITFDRLTLLRAAVKYGPAIVEAVKLGKCIQEESASRNQPCEIEVSVDETDQPTSLAEHYIIADQMREQGVPVISLAPRFLGEFEKGIDFKGDHEALYASMADHAAIARELGPYKLSWHSGSDKISMYAAFGRATQGQFHVKTAGTSYLEAIRVVALCEPDMFREIVTFSRDRYPTDKATYHVSATNEAVAAADQISDVKELERLYLECWEDVPSGLGFTKPGRQILHCTFGSVLTSEKFGPLVKQIISENQDVYTRVLADHFVKHLEALNAG